MKKIVIILLTLFLVKESYSQCVISSFANAANLDCGDSLFIEFNAYASLSLSDTFTAGGPSDTGWASTSGAQYDEPYIPSPTNDDYFWMGPSAVTPTALTTISYDVSGGGQVCFDFVYADGFSGSYAGGGVPEQPDQYDEGISLQYNTGSGWVDIIYYAPNGTILPGNPNVTTPGVGAGGGPFEVWTSVCVNIPPGALTTSTSFQWVQENNSGSCCDHWGLDNITIASANPAYNIYSVETGQNLGPSPVVFSALPTTDSTFNFFYTAGLSDTCYTSYTIDVNETSLGPDLILDCNQNIVQLQATGVSVNDNFTWTPITALSNPNILNPMASPLDTTDYIFTSSCGVDTVTVNVIANYSFSTSDDTAICIGDTAQLFVYGGAQSYAWTPNNGSISDPTIANPIFTPITTTSYIVVADSAGCIKTDTITIYVSKKKFNLFFLTGAGCSGSSTGGLTAIATGALGPFVYSLDNGTTIVNQSNGAYSGLAGGVYTLTLNDTMGCPIDTTFTVTGGVAVVIDSVRSVNPACVGDTSGSITVYTTPNTGVTFRLNGGTPQTSNVFSGLTDGFFSITAQIGTCPTVTVLDTLSAAATINAIFVDSTNLTCGGSGDGEITVSAVQGVRPYSYSLDNITFQTDSFFTGLNAGTYAIYAMDNNGCRDSVVTSISEPTPLALNNIVANPALCFGGSTGSISFGVQNGLAPYQYSIDSGLTFVSSNTFNNLPAGEYVLQGTDANGCLSNFVNDTINEPTAVVLVEDSTTASTCGAADGVIYVSASGGSNTFTFSKNGGASFQSNGTFTGLTAGLYTILVNDANGCYDSLNVAIANFGAPVLTITSFDSVLCFGGNTASVQLSATGGSTPYQFSVDGGTLQNDSLFTNLTGGLHNFIVSDGIGCQGTVSINIYQPLQINITATQDSTSCFGTNDGQINLVATNGTAPYLYAIDDTSTLQSNPNFTGFSAGNYMAFVIGANGCIDSVAQTVFQADSIVVNNIVIDSVNCFGAADGQISFSATGGVPAYSYSINGGTTFVSTNTFTVDTGSFSLMVQDANACLSDVYTATVFQPTDLVLDSINSVRSNCGLANGSLTVLASGGVSPYSYSLNGGTGQVSGTFNNVAAMNHSVVVTDANNCTETLNIRVDSIQNLTISVTSFDSVSCGGAADATVVVQAAGGQTAYSYTVNGGTAQANGTFSNLSGGNNVFVVSDNIGNCTATITQNIYEPTTLTLTAVQDSVSCNSFADGQITLTANGGGNNYLYALNDTSSVQFSNVFNGLAAGLDTAFVVDENGCFAFVTQTVLQPDTLIITNVNPVDISCAANGSFTINAQGGTLPYSYTINGGTPQTSNVFSLSVGGTYTLGVTDANGCPTATMIDSIIAPDPVTLTIDTATVSLLCNNQNIGFIGVDAAGGTGPYTYSLNNAAFQTDSFFNNLAAGTYSIVVQDVFNCTSPATSVTIIQPNALAGTTSSLGISCFGLSDGSITINSVSGGTAPYSVEVDGVTNTYAANMVFGGLAAGNYPIVVTDANGCILNLNRTVANVTQLVLSVNDFSNVSCFGAADGEISVSATGGTPSYDFTITLGAFTSTSNSNTGAVFSNLEGTEAGLTYTISIEDANACTTNLTQTITQPNQLVIDAIDTSALSCFGASDATMTAIVSGGSAPYTYLWSPSGQTSNMATGLAPGVQSVAVTDANDCTISASQTILDVLPVLATIIPDSSTISMGDTVHLGVIVENALGTNLQYAWTPTEGLSCTDCANPAVTVYNDIVYSVVVTDENGCTSFNYTEAFVYVNDSLFYFIPNAFSPGSDGVNDVFQILGQDIQSVNLMVFNRWGEKVFEGENQYIAWDGTYKGEMQSTGVYTYVVKIKFLNDEEVIKKGSLTLMR